MASFNLQSYLPWLTSHALPPSQLPYAGSYIAPTQHELVHCAFPRLYQCRIDNTLTTRVTFRDVL